jgi:type IV pilus assembly protein PilM
MLVLAVAIKKDYIQARIKSIEEAGLSVNLIDVDSLALTNMFMHANEKLKFLSQENIKVVALVNIGATITNLSIIEEGLIHFSREILIGGKELTEKLSEMLNIDRQAAEELKCDPKDRLPEITPHLELIFTSLISEIRSSFDYYESQSNLPVDRIFLSGGTSLFVGLKDYFNRLLGIPLLECDLISSLGIGANLDLGALKNEAAYLNVACGLALR